MSETFYRTGHLPRVMTNMVVKDGTRSAYAVNSPESFAVCRMVRDRLGNGGDPFNGTVVKTFPCECMDCGERFRGKAPNSVHCGCVPRTHGRIVA